MAANDSLSLPFIIPLSWWRRLQQVAQACETSPGEFIREVVEAEIVRRELLMEHEQNPTLSWLGEINAPSTLEMQ